MESYQSSQILFLYDDMSFSLEEINVFLNQIFEAINKNQKGLLYTSTTNSLSNIEVKIENKYYTCHLKVNPIPLSKIKETKIDSFEGIMILMTKESITQKTFEKEIISIIPSKSRWSSCMILFKEIRDDLCELNGYNEFIGQTIDNYFEVICDCSNLNDFNDDDGIGTINTALQSVTWSTASNNSNNNKKAQKHVKSNEEMNKKDSDSIDIDIGIDKNNNTVNKQKEEGYKQLNEQEIYEQLFEKVKNIKTLNSNTNISDQERRANAEKAMLLMAQMFGLNEENENDSEEEKNINTNKESDKSS